MDWITETNIPERFDRKLNLGCGKKIINNFINVDKIALDNRVKEVDLFSKYWYKQFYENYFDYIYANHFFEHIPNTESFMNVMENIFKVAKNNCILEIRVPYPYFKILIDMDHYRPIDVNTFKRFMSFPTHSLTGFNRHYIKYMKLQKRVAKGQYHIKKYFKINSPPYYALHLIFIILEY